MKIYLAGPCDTEHRTMMVNIARILRRNQELEVYCPWELKIKNAWDYSQEVWAQKVFNADVAAIDNRDWMIMISLGRQSTAGTNWEQGYAYARGKKIFVIQVNNNPTSLMTYCGCNIFVNRNADVENELQNTIYDIQNTILIDDSWYEKTYCETVLT